MKQSPTSHILMVCLLFIALALAILPPLQAQQDTSSEVIVLRSDQESIKLEDMPMPLAIDNLGTLGIRDVIRTDYQANFLPRNMHDKSLLPGTVYWLRLRVQSRLNVDSEWILALGKLTDVEVFSPQHTGVYASKLAGQFVPTSRKEIRTGRFNYVSLQLPARSEVMTYYIKFQNRVDLPPDPNLRLMPKSKWLERTNWTNWIQGIFQGLLWMMLLHNLLLFLGLGDRAYLYYSLYLGAMSIYFLNFYGYWHEFILGEYPWIDYLYMPFSAHLGFIFYLLFIRSYLRTHEQMPRVDEWLKGISIVFALLLLALIALVSVSYQSYLLTERVFFMLIQATFLILMLIVFVWQSDLAARYLVIGTLGMLSGGIVLFLGALEVLQLESNIVYYQWGVLAQVLVFSIGLSVRFQRSEEEKRKAQRNLILQLEENQKLNLKVNRELQDKVKERTAEIEAQKWKIMNQSEEIQAQSEKISEQNQLLEATNKQITDSITYASRIQTATLDHLPEVEQKFAEAFILFRPKDIVSGDFYWYHEWEEKLPPHFKTASQKPTLELSSFTSLIYASPELLHDIENPPLVMPPPTHTTCKMLIAADCTGHGVPGAFMTMLSISILNELVKEEHIYEPDELLHALDEKLIRTMTKQGTSRQDGLEITVIVYDEARRQLKYAAAGNPLYRVRDYDIEVFQASQSSIGYSKKSSKTNKKTFDKLVLDVQPDDVFYMSSDGFHDQFGGTEPQGRKYMKKHFRETLLKISHLPFNKQKERLEEELNQWMGHHKQTDDIVVIGVRF